MGIIELFIIAVGLSMDAFAAAICKGLSMQKMSYKYALITGIYFGGFQALMPLIGYFLSYRFKSYITSFDHWVAFILLAFIGGKMVLESRKPACAASDDSFGFSKMATMAIATSIDALIVGISFAIWEVNILRAVLIIGITTFTFSFFGVKIGKVFGGKLGSKAELVGGLVLIGIGTKVLIEHLIK
ncbi:MAG: manganese efflux pump MntP family protein [Acutalibacteraceae bacterium]